MEQGANARRSPEADDRDDHCSHHIGGIVSRVLIEGPPYWSTVLNGMQVDLDGFRRETDTVLRLAGERAKTAKAQ
jgi:hypothetical protein